MYEVTIKRTGTEYGTNRPIYTVDTTDAATGHVCNTLSWFSVELAREYAADMSGRYLDCPIVDETESDACEDCGTTKDVVYYDVTARIEYGLCGSVSPLCPRCKMRAESEGADVEPHAA